MSFIWDGESWQVIAKDGIEDTTNWNKKISYADDYSNDHDNPKFIVIDSENNVCVASIYNATKFSPSGQLLWTKEYANNKTFTGIYNNSKNTDILIQTASAVLCIANDGSMQ